MSMPLAYFVGMAWMKSLGNYAKHCIGNKKTKGGKHCPLSTAIFGFNCFILKNEAACHFLTGKHVKVSIRLYVSKYSH